MPNPDTIQTNRNYDVFYDKGLAKLLVDGDVYEFEVFVPTGFDPNRDEDVSVALDSVQDKEKELYRAIEGDEVRHLVPNLTYHLDNVDLILAGIERSVSEYDLVTEESQDRDDIVFHFRREWDHYGPQWTDKPVHADDLEDIGPPKDRVPVFPNHDMFEEYEDTEQESIGDSMIQE